MARIVELTYPSNVTLLRGAMQNWRDLAFPRPSASEVVRQLVPPGPAGRVLVVGPYAVASLRDIADRADQLTVITRAIPDAAEIGEGLPTAQVLCGDLHEVEGDFDLILAIDDLAIVQSLECQTLTWADLAAQLVTRLAPDGQLLLGIENERGFHRSTGADDPYVRNADADWTPFATWDASRPRTPAQVADWTPPDRPYALYEVLGTWSQPTGILHGDRTAALGTLWMGRSSQTPVLALRSAALAGRGQDHVAGWVVRVGSRDSGDWLLTEATRWTLDGDAACSEAGATLLVPPHGLGPFTAFVEAAADTDTPAMRDLLQRWAAWLGSVAIEGQVPAAYADARLTNLVRDGEGFAPLAAAPAAQTFEVTAWTALGEAMGLMMNQGLRQPWPTAMHRETRLGALGTMAGLTPPDDLSPFLPVIRDVGQSRADLLAVIRRQQEAAPLHVGEVQMGREAVRSLEGCQLRQACRQVRQEERSLAPQTDRQAGSCPGHGPARPNQLTLPSEVAGEAQARGRWLTRSPAHGRALGDVPREHLAGQLVVGVRGQADGRADGPDVGRVDLIACPDVLHDLQGGGGTAGPLAPRRSAPIRGSPRPATPSGSPVRGPPVSGLQRERRVDATVVPREGDVLLDEHRAEGDRRRRPHRCPACGRTAPPAPRRRHASPGCRAGWSRWGPPG